MAKTRRELKRERTEAEIKDVARQQMMNVGAAALSLRAIAREMGLSAPALYRYFPNRDALVTTLIIEAYLDLGDQMEAANLAVTADDYYGRLQAIALAYRTWAVAHPQDYTLIYGTPIPGYHAPRDQTVAPASRVQQLFGLVVGEAIQAGAIQPASVYIPNSNRLAQQVEEVMAYLDEPVPPVFITLTMLVWSRLHGVLWGELYGHFLPGIAEHGELYKMELAALCIELGLQPKD
ncbi:MAG: TetR/AcrR family transcriptional regulator [Chloroflexi bacterium]|nr:TetR/AcrR family transcriptional regulator [Chloroflexota bacterium]